MPNRFVIPDIHGCLNTLKELISKIGLSKQDELYFLGDYIDRGPNSSGVIDFIIGLKNEDYKIVALRGNHEQNILTAINEYDALTFHHYVSKMNKSPDLLDSNLCLIEKYFNFFTDLPYYIELDQFYLVHAGFDTFDPKPFDDTASMLETRHMTYDTELFLGKRIIHGHHVRYLDEIQESIERQAMIIGLDNGCVFNRKHRFYDYKKLGHLCCLDLDSFELIIQANCD